jgi:hypothetical protein
MSAVEIAQSHFNSWNRHDADAIVAAYAKGGTYRKPRVDHDLTGQAIGDFAKSVWTAFPDASLEMISIGYTSGGLAGLLSLMPMPPWIATIATFLFLSPSTWMKEAPGIGDGATGRRGASINGPVWLPCKDPLNGYKRTISKIEIHKLVDRRHAFRSVRWQDKKIKRHSIRCAKPKI